VLTFASIFLPKLTEASKAKKNDSKISTMTMPKTMSVQNVLRYMSFEFSVFNNRFIKVFCFVFKLAVCLRTRGASKNQDYFSSVF
jgi:hypothetical protein